MEDKRRMELEEEMSRFEQEIAGQLPPPPKPPSLGIFASTPSLVAATSSISHSTRRGGDLVITSSHNHAFHENLTHSSQGHGMQGNFQVPPLQNVMPPGLPLPPLHPSTMPLRPQMPLPPPLPNMATPPMGLSRGNNAPIGPPAMGPAPLIPPPMPPMLPMMAPAPLQTVAATSTTPIIKPPTVPLDNYEPLPSSGDLDDVGEGTSAEGKDDNKKKEKKKKYVRTGGGTVWEDDSLTEWDPSDFRIFVGDLGNEVTDEHLYRAFSKYASVLRARVVRDKKTKKTKGYGFVSFKDPQDYLKAMREMNGKYVGNRPIKLRKSTWKDRNIEIAKKKEKEKKKLGLR